jgi:hypothetical protein
MAALMAPVASVVPLPKSPADKRAHTTVRWGMVPVGVSNQPGRHTVRRYGGMRPSALSRGTARSTVQVVLLTARGRVHMPVAHTVQLDPMVCGVVMLTLAPAAASPPHVPAHSQPALGGGAPIVETVKFRCSPVVASISPLDDATRLWMRTWGANGEGDGDVLMLGVVLALAVPVGLPVSDGIVDVVAVGVGVVDTVGIADTVVEAVGG